jgi:hypothetical protein
MSAAEIVRAVRAAAGAAGDVSGNCDAASFNAERGNLNRAAEELQWAEDNLRSAIHRIADARAAIAAATGSAS